MHRQVLVNMPAYNFLATFPRTFRGLDHCKHYAEQPDMNVCEPAACTRTCTQVFVAASTTVTLVELLGLVLPGS